MALRLALVLLLRALLVQSNEGNDISLTPDQAAALNLTSDRTAGNVKVGEMKRTIIDPDHIDEGDDMLFTANQSAALNLTERMMQDVETIEIDDLLLTRAQAAAIASRKAVNNVAQHWPDENGFPHTLNLLTALTIHPLSVSTNLTTTTRIHSKLLHQSEPPQHPHTPPFFNHTALVDRTAVEAAIQHWRDHTCITFTEVAQTETGPRLRFIRHASSCNSFVGYINRADGQIINVPEWCEESFGSLVHEIGHAMGFWHEQSRSDRDSYVSILTHNIRPAALGNFDLEVDNSYGVPYDYKSDMHYGGKGFTKNGLNTIVSIDPRYQDVMGQRTGLSHMDKLLANTMYGCTAKLLGTCGIASDPCQNYGFLGKDCNCVCPEGTSGSNCETLVTPYNDIGFAPNTEIVTEPKTITTVGYPSDFALYTDFVKWIKAPACKLIKITFTDFELYQKTDKTVDGVTVNACWHDHLELRTSNMLEGDWYCGTSISAGQEFITTGNEAVLYFQARTNFNRGFSADNGLPLSPGTILIPSAQFLATFTSNERYRWRGFNLRLRVKSDTETFGDGGVITSPMFPKPHRGTYCEWHITASEGKKVQIDVTHLRIRYSNFLAVNPTTELYYRRGSVIYLPHRWAPRQIVSDSNLIRILFAGKYGSKGFRIEYSEVDNK
ncbi:putative protein SpAN-like [Penaeus vannamei]|uniref:Metalloendopeptidase n=1 Tax=Penaeus vannamei TaxID=6689 RepID=A0A3R7PTD8_PENVA|nr:putative protein SpAN-like [Penaeus vannamei]